MVDIKSMVVIIIQYQMVEIKSMMVIIVQYKMVEIKSMMVIIVQYRMVDIKSMMVIIVQYRMVEIKSMVIIIMQSFKDSSQLSAKRHHHQSFHCGLKCANCQRQRGTLTAGVLYCNQPLLARIHVIQPRKALDVTCTQINQLQSVNPFTAMMSLENDPKSAKCETPKPFLFSWHVNRFSSKCTALKVHVL